jgi:predicted Rossmann fold flavoprotein
MQFDAIIIGGGAAGLFCAGLAGKRGCRVLVIERNAQVGRKILISGGGRCNFTNLNVGAENFVSRNPHFAKSALARYTPQHFIELVRRHKIPYYEKKLGQLFCRESSKQIVAMLMAECELGRVDVRTACSVEQIEKAAGETFRISTNQGEFESGNLVVATGGLSFAKVGATDLGYRIARQFGLKVIETRPSLVPLVFAGEGYRELAGVSVDSLVSANGVSFRENILFTHRGLSGPAILQASNYWDPADPLHIDLLPDRNARELIEANRTNRKRLDNFFSDLLPAKVAERLLNPKRTAKPLAQMSDKEVETTAAAIGDWSVRFRDTEGYDKAEVTLGGVSTDELSSKTMEVRKVPGLYFIGEVVDVTGWLGGYNFQWAWASGAAAAEAI